MTNGIKIILGSLGEGLLKLGISPVTMTLGAGTTSLTGTFLLQKDYPKDMVGASLLGTGITMLEVGSSEFEGAMNRLGFTQEYIESLDEGELSTLIEKLEQKKKEQFPMEEEESEENLPKEKTKSKGKGA